MPGNSVQRKTEKPSEQIDPNKSKADAEAQRASDQSKQIVDLSNKKNVLNNYRSYTYNFTLAALQADRVNDPKKYRESELNLVILKSGGKGPPIDNKKDSIAAAKKAYDDQSTSLSATTSTIAQSKKDLYAIELSSGFDKSSPGRFDMFIDSVEIDTIMAFSQQAGTTLPTKIKFDVIEPYSINGFIEALHVKSVEAGYVNYSEASFILKMDFWGYPDGDEFDDPVIVEKSTRYFTIKFAGLEVEVTDRGTKYVCSAIPFNEAGFGQPGVIKKPIKMTGKTIGEILTDLMEKVTAQEIDNEKNSKEKSPSNDEYKIKFQDYSEDSKQWVDAPNSAIPSSKLIEIGKDNALYKMVSPGDTKRGNGYRVDSAPKGSADQKTKESENLKYSPSDSAMQFPEKANIHEIIAAVIRDSEYIRNILKDVKGNIDSYGMVKYFSVRLEVENKKEINPVSKKPYQRFIYVVSPFKIHYTAIPNFGDQKIDEKNLRKRSTRDYNYIYTGQNVDILNFKLNFNNLYFEALPAAMGNKDVPSTKTGAGPTNGAVVKRSDDKKSASNDRQIETPQTPGKTDAGATSVRPNNGYNAGLPLTDPYSVLAKSMHETILNSVSMLTGEMEILGDPFYLVTGGIGNYNPKLDNSGETVDGEAPFTHGQVLITITFRNPIDINSFEDGGMMYFDSQRVPFSGVYMVTEVASRFRDGQFKQIIKVIRIPGQIIDQDLSPSDPKDTLKVTPDPQNQVTEDVTPAVASPSQRLNDSTALDQLGRGLPSPGLPGQLSNFTAATGGLGGTASGLLNQTFGFSSLSAGLSAGSAAIGLPLPNDIATNIRLSQSGLADIGQYSLANAAKVISTVNNLPQGSLLGNAKNLAENLSLNSIDKALKTLNPGSGIGQGATSTLLSAADLALTGGTFSLLTSPPMASITGAVMDKAVGLASKQIGGLVNDAANNVGSLLGSAADPAGLAAKVGLNVAGLSGLGSKVGLDVAGLSGLGSKVGLDVASLSGVAGALQSKVLGKLFGGFGGSGASKFGGVSKPKFGMPTKSAEPVGYQPDINLSQALNSGLILDYIPSSKLKNIPATEPYSTAPVPDVDKAYLKEVVAKGGPKALASLYGVTDVNKISADILPKDLVSTALSSVSPGKFNPLSKIGSLSNFVDVSAFKDKVAGAGNMLSSLSGVTAIKDQNIIGSVASKFGSSSLGQSPLDKLVNRIGDPTSPPYTGANSVIRASLGMPPLSG